MPYAVSNCQKYFNRAYYVDSSITIYQCFYNCNGKYLGEAAYPLHNTTLYLRPANQISIFMLEFAPVN